MRHGGSGPRLSVCGCVGRAARQAVVPSSVNNNAAAALRARRCLAVITQGRHVEIPPFYWHGEEKRDVPPPVLHCDANDMHSFVNSSSGDNNARN